MYDPQNRSGLLYPIFCRDSRPILKNPAKVSLPGFKRTESGERKQKGLSIFKEI
jgi:hypothetical protein